MHKKWFDLDLWLIVLLAFLVGCLLATTARLKRLKRLKPYHKFLLKLQELETRVIELYTKRG